MGRARTLVLSDVVANDAIQRLRVLEEIARTLPAPPIVVTHDTGVVTGPAFAAAIGAPAIVAIAPVGIPTEPSPTGIFAHPQFLWARMFGSGVQPPRGRAARLLLRGLGRSRIASSLDSGPFLRAVLSRRARVHDPPPRPGLLVWSREDLIMPVSSAERTAERLGWSFDVHESAGHFPMLAGGCERLADRVHRWIVKAVGADLLAWLDDDDVPE